MKKNVKCVKYSKHGIDIANSKMTEEKQSLGKQIKSQSIDLKSWA